MKKIFTFILLVLFISQVSYAGNPDRQGQAGAYELLLNPWAKSAGLNNMTTAMVKGVESMRLNIAGLSRIENMEFSISATDHFSGSGVSLLSAGLAKKVGKGAFGISIMSVNFGDIPVTTTNQPGGTGFNYTPSFVNIGIGYAYNFKNVSVGALVRVVSERVGDSKATGVAIDAGIQYIPEDNDRFKFGISLRNTGGRMQFTGQDFLTEVQAPEGEYPIFVSQVTQDFEIPSVLNIGASYDILKKERSRLTALVNFTSNAFSRDNLGGGLEYSFMEKFTIRGGYKADVGTQSTNGGIQGAIQTGISGGVSIDLPVKKGSTQIFSLDYAYQTTDPYSGNHSLGIRYNL